MRIKNRVGKQRRGEIRRNLGKIMKCMCSGEQSGAVDEMVPSSELLATKDYSETAIFSEAREFEKKLDTGNIEEAESSLRESGCLNYEVLARLAPFERGIYEDYVANFWCATSVLIEWKRMFTTESLKLFSLGATISTCLPSMVQQIRAPSSQGFLYGVLLNSAFSFYMFSFQVHEKSILLPLLPASLFALEEPFLLKWITLNALFSMFPLLCCEKLILPYTALSALFILICYHLPSRRQDRKETRSFNTYMTTFLVLCSVILHGVYLTNHPPRRYPFLFEL